MQHDALVADVIAPLVTDHGPGCAVAVIQDGELRALVTRGLANVEHAVPITDKTVFHVASVSKQFTAYAVACLVAEGRLELDRPVTEVLPWVPFPDITTRQLLHHTSGVRDQWELFVLSGRSIEDEISTRHIEQLLRRQHELNFEPGSDQTYSNSGYTLLALIVEEITGQTLREWGQATIFEPLAMADTRWCDDHHEVIPRRADSYVPRADGGWRRMALSYSTVGATSLNSSVTDLARWARHVMAPQNKHLWSDPAVLSDGTATGYAFGLMVEERRGRTWVGHSGGDAGFRAYLLTVPADQLGVVVCSNHGGLGTAGLATRIASAILGDDTTVREPNWSPTDEELQALAGLYVNRADGSTHHLVYTDGTLAYDTFDERVPLHSLRPGVLGVPGSFELSLRDNGFQVTAQVSPSHRWERANPAPAWTLDEAIGFWWCDELESGFRIHEQDGQLFLSSPPWGSIRLRPTLPGWFAFPIPMGVHSMKADGCYNAASDELFITTGRARRLRHRRLSR